MQFHESVMQPIASSQVNSSAGAAPAGAGAAVESRAALAGLSFAGCVSREALLESICHVLKESLAPAAIVRCVPQANGETVLDGLLYPATGFPRALQSALASQTALALSRQATQHLQLDAQSRLITAVSSLPTSPPEALAVVLTGIAAPAEQEAQVLELGCSQLQLFDLRELQRATDDAAESAAALVELQTRLQSCSGISEAAALLTRQLAEYLDVPIVALLQRQGDSWKLLALQGAANANGLTEDLVGAAEETLLRGEPSSWPTPKGETQQQLLTYRQLAGTLNMAAVAGIPISEPEQRFSGALIVAGGREVLDPPDALRFLRAASGPLAVTLGLLHRSEPSRWQQRWQKWRAALGRRSLLLLGLGGMALSGIMAYPVPYRVACDCELQPVIRRYVAAPFEGRLLEILVDPGEAVQVGQPLARLDGREVRGELERTLADLQRALKTKDGHLASGKAGEAELSRLEAESLRQQSELLQHRLERLELRSPIAGMIVSGELRRTEGAPVKLGQPLFEIAPLDALTAELRVPEREISYLQLGQSATVRLEAFPGRQWTAPVERIAPRAEAIDRQQVFVTEVTLDNPELLLRPGMQGEAVITTAARPLGWNLFHHALDRVRFWGGW